MFGLMFCFALLMALALRVMPLHSFRADASDGPWQGEFRVVWHG